MQWLQEESRRQQEDLDFINTECADCALAEDYL